MASITAFQQFFIAQRMEIDAKQSECWHDQAEHATFTCEQLGIARSSLQVWHSTLLQA